MIKKTKNLNIKFNSCGYDDYVYWLDLLKKKQILFVKKIFNNL